MAEQGVTPWLASMRKLKGTPEQRKARYAKARELAPAAAVQPAAITPTAVSTGIKAKTGEVQPTEPLLKVIEGRLRLAEQEVGNTHALSGTAQKSFADRVGEQKISYAAWTKEDQKKDPQGFKSFDERAQKSLKEAETAMKKAVKADLDAIDKMQTIRKEYTEVYKKLYPDRPSPTAGIEAKPPALAKHMRDWRSPKPFRAFGVEVPSLKERRAMGLLVFGLIILLAQKKIREANTVTLGYNHGNSTDSF